jgi:hypothetical protein
VRPARSRPSRSVACRAGVWGGVGVGGGGKSWRDCGWDGVGQACCCREARGGMNYLFHALLIAATAVFLHVRQPCNVGITAVVMLAIAGVIQFFVWPSLGGSIVDGVFTSHWMYAAILLRGGTEALRGDGYPVCVHPAIACVAVMALVFIALHEIHFTHLHAFHNWVHLLIYCTGALIAFGTGAARLAEKVAGCCSCDALAAVALTRSIRKVADPAGFSAMGLLLVGHVHDPAPLSVGLHATFGYFLMLLGAAIFVCSLAHDVLPADSPACAALRRVHAFAWLLTGGITITMCAVKYGTPQGAFKAYLESHSIRPSSNLEELSAYTALTILGCVVHLVLLHLSSPALAMSAGEAVTAATDGHRSPGARTSLLLPIANEEESEPMVEKQP